MPIYSSEVIEEVVSRNDIVDVISGYIKLKKSDLLFLYQEQNRCITVLDAESEAML